MNTFPTSRQADAIAAIREITRETGKPPSATQIGERLGISRLSARKLLKSLETKGLVADVPVTVSSGTWSVTAEGKRWLTR